MKGRCGGNRNHFFFLLRELELLPRELELLVARVGCVLVGLEEEDRLDVDR